MNQLDMERRDRMRRRRHAEMMRRRRRRRNLWIALGILCTILFAIILITFTVGRKSGKTANTKGTAVTQSSAETTTQETTVSPDYAKNQKHTVMLDAGHGHNDSGCYYKKLYEKDVTLKTAEQTKEYLEEMGFKVLMLRDKDVYYDVFKRAQMANAKKPDIFVSIHVDSEGADANGDTVANGSCSGTSAFYTSRKTAKDQKLAKAVVDHVAQNTGERNRGAQEENAYIVNINTTMPSTLVEIGFMSNKKDRALMSTDEGIQKYARGIADGINQYFNN